MKSFESNVQTVVTCNSAGPTCSWIFKQAHALDISNIVAVQDFCRAGLHRVGVHAGMMHTVALDKRLAHLACFPGAAFLFSMCAFAEATKSCTGTAPAPGSSMHSEDPALSFFMWAFKAVIMVSHCLDVSEWPMTVAEFSANFQLFVEQGPGCGFRWMRPRRGLPFISGVSGVTLHDGAPSHQGFHNHAEVHMRVTWAIGWVGQNV